MTSVTSECHLLLCLSVCWTLPVVLKLLFIYYLWDTLLPLGQLSVISYSASMWTWPTGVYVYQRSEPPLKPLTESRLMIRSGSLETPGHMILNSEQCAVHCGMLHISAGEGECRWEQVKFSPSWVLSKTTWRRVAHRPAAQVQISGVPPAYISLIWSCDLRRGWSLNCNPSPLNIDLPLLSVRYISLINICECRVCLFSPHSVYIKIR